MQGIEKEVEKETPDSELIIIADEFLLFRLNHILLYPTDSKIGGRRSYKLVLLNSNIPTF